MNEAEMNIGLRPRAPRNTGRGDMSTESIQNTAYSPTPAQPRSNASSVFRSRTYSVLPMSVGAVHALLCSKST